jgi:hypothetical protein
VSRPKGAWSEKRFRDALLAAVTEDSGDGRSNLRVIAEKLVECAKGGESWAIQQVSDRVDGKAPQDVSINNTVTHELANVSDVELAALIKRELASLAGRGEATPDKRQLN